MPIKCFLGWLIFYRCFLFLETLYVRGNCSACLKVLYYALIHCSELVGHQNNLVWYSKANK